MRTILSTYILLIADVTAGYLLPSPPGKYNVTLTTGTLVDYTRHIGNATMPEPRALMLSVFEPASCGSIVQAEYMPKRTAEHQESYINNLFNVSGNFTPLFLGARLPVCPNECAGSSLVKDSPILLFSPGYNTPRLYYSVLASAIAGEGFTVITMDHPEDANIITYPDGHAVYYNVPSNLSIDEEFTKHMYDRVADASFVIDQLSNAAAIADLLPRRGRQPFPTDRVAMLGHSLGGAASVIAAGQDARIRGAIDWDGTLFGSLPPSGLSKPVLYMSNADDTDPSWLEAWPQLKGPKLWARVANTTHQSFTDVLSLMQAAGQDTTAFAPLLGALAPTEMVRILATYTAEWMNGVFTGNVGGPLLEGQEPDKFPAVSIDRKENF